MRAVPTLLVIPTPERVNERLSRSLAPFGETEAYAGYLGAGVTEPGCAGQRTHSGRAAA